jgi:hypothetical protein
MQFYTGVDIAAGRGWSMSAIRRLDRRRSDSAPGSRRLGASSRIFFPIFNIAAIIKSFPTAPPKSGSIKRGSHEREDPGRAEAAAQRLR